MYLLRIQELRLCHLLTKHWNVSTHQSHFSLVLSNSLLLNQEIGRLSPKCTLWVDWSREAWLWWWCSAMPSKPTHQKGICVLCVSVSTVYICHWKIELHSTDISHSGWSCQTGLPGCYGKNVATSRTMSLQWKASTMWPANLLTRHKSLQTEKAMSSASCRSFLFPFFDFLFWWAPKWSRSSPGLLLLLLHQTSDREFCWIGLLLLGESVQHRQIHLCWPSGF